MDLFQPFPSLTRFSHGWTISEKLDGANSQVIIQRNPEVKLHEIDQWSLGHTGGDEGFTIFAASRNRLISAEKSKDNHGFAQFVKDNATALVETLGEGRHFGEWVGKGINKRGYNLDQKVFALFNTARWTGVELPDRVRIVPVIGDQNMYLDNPGTFAVDCLEYLKETGSKFSPGYLDPEGIVMRHGPSGTLFKKTFDYDEQGKWAENEERRNAALS